MQGIAELFTAGLWRVLPKLRREELSRKILNLQARARVKIPLSDVSVYAFTHPSRELFHELRVVDLTAEEGGLPAGRLLPRYSLVTTCKNEERNIAELLDTISRQAALPEEVIIVDGGSRDRTVERIRSWVEKKREERLPYEVTVIEESSLSIAAGRNRGVERARADIILFTDAGVTLDRHWAERLLAPYARDAATEAVMGWYEPVLKTKLQKAVAHYLVPRLHTIDPATFLPSGRSVGVTKAVFEVVGGFPEHLTLAGEDSLFGYYLKTAARNIAFVPDAIAYWKFPETAAAMVRTVRNYATGDAESGMLFWYYYLFLVSTCAKIAGEYLLFALFAWLWVITDLTFFFALAFVVFLSATLRTVLLIKGYQPLAGKHLTVRDKATRLLGLVLFLGSQCFGFVKGLRMRKRAEDRRLKSASSGHLVLLVPKFHLYDAGDSISRRIVQSLKSRSYVTVIFSQGLEDPDEKAPLFEHPHLENHLRSAFVFDAWEEKHKRFLSQETFAFTCIDLCHDSWSKDLAARFQRAGARVSAT